MKHQCLRPSIEGCLGQGRLAEGGGLSTVELLEKAQSLFIDSRQGSQTEGEGSEQLTSSSKYLVLQTLNNVWCNESSKSKLVSSRMSTVQSLPLE